jgi:hypothetical protein
LSTQLRENVEVNSARLYGGEDRVISLDEVKQLVVLCVRLESLSAGEVFGNRLDAADDSASLTEAAAIKQQAARWHAAYTFGPTVSAEMTDEELTAIIESLTTRIENAMSTLVSEERGVLLDCGEGAHPDLARRPLHCSTSNKSESLPAFCLCYSSSLIRLLEVSSRRFQHLGAP